MMVADTQSPVIGRYGSASLSTYPSMCIGHVNIEIIFLCYTQSKSGWLFNTQSRELKRQREVNFEHFHVLFC